MKNSVFTSIAVLAMLILYSSCSSKPKNDVNTHSTINIYDQDHETNPKYKSIRFIPLETKEDALIGQIDKIVSSPKRYFVLDRKKAKSIFIFNKDGSLFKTIGAIGKGPREYTRLSDIGFDPYNLELVIVDSELRKIIKYDQDGNFIKEEFFNFRPHNIGFVDKNTYAFKTISGDAGPMVITIDHNTKNQRKVLDLVFEFNIHWTYYFHGSPSGQLFSEHFNDTVWKIEKDRASPYLILNYEGSGMNEEDLAKLRAYGRKTRTIPFFPDDKSGDLRKYFETENYIQIKYKNLGNSAYVLVDKKDNQPICQMDYNSDKVNELGVLWFLMHCVDKSDAFIGFMSASHFLDVINSNEVTNLLTEGVISIETNGFENQDHPKLSSNHILFVIEL